MTAIADRGSSRVDTGGQCRFRDDTPSPDLGDQIVLADHAFAVSDQVLQKIEDLPLDSNEICPVSQLSPLPLRT